MGDYDFEARMEELRQESRRQQEIDEAARKEEAERKRELDRISSRPIGGYGGGGGAGVLYLRFSVGPRLSSSYCL